ncbi:GNAT family N-acetyltransferase [Lysinibacillus sp. SGAir0095]|uniref:GNAT family N-acetyltransferase n=1 Tax=Lysinibacillus sp. SGAir0095 TaxID=2070463 RepID=UPI0010CCEFCE|nr:GNAT family N-acetyltransferase [Lysinibacillus sp. SGAir0095]QCR31606.1 GNAT family N-acetyltransferase [Lysinibacillus sp. SGAir0095]
MYQINIVKNEKDLALAFSVRKKVFVEEQGVPEHLELDEHDSTSIHFIVQDQDHPIGAARLRKLDETIGKVERVCVLEPFRGKKLGILIMEKIEEYAKELGIKKLKLNAQSYAIPFYEKLQYTTTSPEFLDAGIPHRAMEKLI